MKLVGEGVLPSPVRSFAWSPAVDLCVFVMAEEVSAHRLTGHKVWTITVNGLHSPDLEFTHVAWRQDGIPLITLSQEKQSRQAWTMDQFTCGMYKMDGKYVG
jgi:hypothetical protein